MSSTQHIETLIIGAGQAGLSMGYHLRRRGREFLIVDGDARIGDTWRRRYDSLRLFTPAQADGLDGLPFPGDPWHFPSKDEMADYLELYAMTHDLPVRLQSRVDRVGVDRVGRHEGSDGEHFIVDLDGHRLVCDNVVVATGTFGHTPYVPDLAGRLDPGIRQVHSGEYTSPAQLPAGPALVVGASHSGLDIAFELGESRRTILVGPARGNLPLEWDSPRLRIAFPLIEFAFNHVLTRRTPMGRKVMAQLRHHGAPQLRIKRHHLADRDVEWIEEHVVDVSAEGLPQLASGRTVEVSIIVWATGFRQSYDWLDLPIRIVDGWPVEYRGVVAEVPGLFFCGLAFQYAFSSGEMSGVGRDAAFIADRITERMPQRTRPRIGTAH